MKAKNKGFTLLELIIVVLILGILGVTVAPRFLGIQRDSHEAVAQGAFAAFRNSIEMYHSQWLVDGEPAFNQVVNYGEGDVYPSDTGFPISVLDTPPTTSPILVGEQCEKIWTALMNTDLTIRSYTSNVFPSNTNIVSWYQGTSTCFYYYTTGYSLGEALPRLNYNINTGEVEITVGEPHS